MASGKVFLMAAVLTLGLVGVIMWIIVTSKMSRTFAEPEVDTIGISSDIGTVAKPLQLFHIKSSYNSCASGDYQNDFVSLAALTNAIKNGCRVLDFEIYDLLEEPVVAVSTSPQHTFKGSYNSIPLQEVLKKVKQEAFIVSNGRDPLFLQFRFKTDHVKICNKTATLLKDHFGNVLLPNQYNFLYGGKNLAEVPLKAFIGKVAIIVDMSNPIVNQSTLKEFANLGANTVFNRVMTFQDLAYNAPSDILDFSKQYMLTCTPEVKTAANYDSSVGFNQGAQIIAMKFQTKDQNLELYNEKFAGYAYMLKSEDLQFEPTIVPDAPELPKSYNFGNVTDTIKAGTMQPIVIS
jgi:hypothetical protein